MSVLHDRVMGEQYLQSPSMHPAGTPETPMVMPVTAHTYVGDAILYGNAHPLVTADGATVPAWADVTYPETVPAGRP